MTFSINDIKSHLVHGGARPCHFEVNVYDNGKGLVNQQTKANLRFLCTASSLPPVTISKIPVPYFGRNVYEAGQQSWDSWSITVLNDEDFGIYDSFVNWANKINAPESNLREFNSAASSEYKCLADVTQFSKAGRKAIKKVKMIGIWPSSVSEIALDYSSGSSIETFGVTFSVDWVVQDTADVNQPTSGSLSTISAQ